MDCKTHLRIPIQSRWGHLGPLSCFQISLILADNCWPTLLWEQLCSNKIKASADIDIGSNTFNIPAWSQTSVCVRNRTVTLLASACCINWKNAAACRSLTPLTRPTMLTFDCTNQKSAMRSCKTSLTTSQSAQINNEPIQLAQFRSLTSIWFWVIKHILKKYTTKKHLDLAVPSKTATVSMLTC